MQAVRLCPRLSLSERQKTTQNTLRQPTCVGFARSYPAATYPSPGGDNRMNRPLSAWSVLVLGLLMIAFLAGCGVSARTPQDQHRLQLPIRRLRRTRILLRHRPRTAHLFTSAPQPHILLATGSILTAPSSLSPGLRLRSAARWRRQETFLRRPRPTPFPRSMWTPRPEL